MEVFNPITSHDQLTGVTADLHQAQSHDHSAAGDGQSLSPVTLNVGAGGIVFPAIALALAGVNILDDFEVGSFTAELADDSLDGSGEGQGYNSQVGEYVKIGNVCHFWVLVRMTSIGTLTGAQQARIVGMPFPSRNLANMYATFAGNGQLLGIVAGDYAHGVMYNNVSYIALENWDAAGGTTALTITEFSADGLMRLAGSYEVEE